MAKRGRSQCGRHPRRNKTAVTRIAGNVNDAAISTADPDEAIVRFGRIQILHLPCHRVIARPVDRGQQGICNLPCPARLGIQDRRFEIVTEKYQRQGAKHYEYRRQHTCIPYDQAETERPRIHRSTLSPSPYPTPRTVRINLVGNGSSTLLRRWRTYTSTMLVKPSKL